MPPWLLGDRTSHGYSGKKGLQILYNPESSPEVGGRKLTYAGVFRINYNGRCVIDRRPTLRYRRHKRVRVRSSERDHRSRGGGSVFETRTRTSNVVLGALCPRALLASTPDVSWKWTLMKAAQLPRNTLLCYSLGEPGVLGLGLGHDGRHNNKAEPVTKLNFLISCTCQSCYGADAFLTVLFGLCRIYVHTILLILYERNR